MFLLIFIIILAEISFILFFYNKNGSLRESILKGLTLLFLGVLGVVELLSLFHKLQSTYLLATLLLLISVLFLVSINLFNKNKIIVAEKLNTYKKKTKKLFKKPSFLMILIIFTLLFISGSYFPPNNWDSMAYHLPRVGHWIQENTVSFYPTNDERKLFLGPLAEYFLSVILLIDKSDKFLFLGQFISAIGSLLAISLISNNIFKQTTNTQIKTALIALTIPMSILQAISTQNDYVGSFFILSAIFFLFSKNDKVFFPIASSLAILTKMTSIFYIFPMILFWMKQKFLLKKHHLIVLYIPIFILINSAHLYRNYDFFGSILGPKARDYIVSSINPKYFLINTLKNVSIHLDSSSSSWNNYIVKSTVNFSKLINIDVNDNKITYLSEKYLLRASMFDHDRTGNFLHFILILYSVTAMLFIKKNISFDQKKYFILSISGLALSFIIIKWQPWASRLHLPGFLLFSPIIMIFLQKNKFLQRIIILPLFIFSLLTIFLNQSQPLRNFGLYNEVEKFRYIKKPNLYNDYKLIKNYILNNYENSIDVGLISEGNEWEYPLWYYLYKSESKFTLNTMFFDSNSNILLYENQPTPNIIIHLDSSMCDTNCNKLIDKNYTEEKHLKLKNTKLYTLNN